MKIAADKLSWKHVAGSCDGDFVESLYDIANRISVGVPLDEVLGGVVELVMAALKCDSCTIYELQASQLSLRASSNPLTDRHQFRIDLGRDSATCLAEYQKTIVIPTCAHQDVRSRRFSHSSPYHFEAFLSVPVLSRGRLMGLISIQNRAKYDFRESETELLMLLGSFLGAEIQRQRLESANASLRGLLRDGHLDCVSINPRGL